MGRDKTRLEWNGAPLAVRLAGLLSECFEEVLLVGGDPPAAAPGRRVPDPAGTGSALRGIVGALEAAGNPWVAVVATDLPALTADLLLGLVASSGTEADVVMPRTDRPEPLCALYRRETVLSRAQAQLARGELAIKRMLGDLDVVWIEGADLARVDGASALTNVNTPEQWQRFTETAG